MKEAISNLQESGSTLRQTDEPATYQEILLGKDDCENEQIDSNPHARSNCNSNRRSFRTRRN
jgi:hypothetical protein